MPDRVPRTSLKARTLAALLGSASVLAFAPANLFPLIWASFGGIFLLLDQAASRNLRATEGALLGGLFGFGLFISGVSWIYVSLSVFGGMPMAVAAVATTLFCLAMSLYPALAGALFVRFAPHDELRRGLFFAALWTLAEWLRGWVLTGFPWLAAGYSQTPPSPLAGFAPLLGVYGISFLTVLSSVLIALAGKRWFSGPGNFCKLSAWIRTCPAMPLMAFGLILAVGQALQEVRWTTPSGEPVSVALLQGNIAQDLKWRPEKFSESLRPYYQLARDHPAQLTILPETALPAFLEQIPQEYLDELRALAARKNGDMLFGVATGEAGAYANAAISIGRSGEQRYFKSHLVPFGETIPPGFAWFMAMARIPMSDFTPGPRTQPPMILGDQRVALNICYEDAFGEEIIRSLPDATLLVNISNVAWFGDSLAPAQHLQIARIRALETGRTMLRATNTGMTAIIGPDGHITEALPPFRRAALQAEVRGYSGATPYVRSGNLPVVFGCLLLLAFARRRKALS